MVLKIHVLWAVALCEGRVKQYTLTLTIEALRPFEISIIIGEYTWYNTPQEFNLRGISPYRVKLLCFLTCHFI